MYESGILQEKAYEPGIDRQWPNNGSIGLLEPTFRQKDFCSFAETLAAQSFLQVLLEGILALMST